MNFQDENGTFQESLIAEGQVRLNNEINEFNKRCTLIKGEIHQYTMKKREKDRYR